MVVRLVDNGYFRVFLTLPFNYYLIVLLEYFTKLIEAEPVKTIIGYNILCLFKRYVFTKFIIPKDLVVENTKQFIGCDLVNNMRII